MRRSIVAAGCASLALLTTTACSGSGGAAAEAATCDGTIDGPVTLTSFYHGGGAEKETFLAQVEAFNASQDQVTVEVQSVPEGTYGDSVRAAAASGDLPHILDFDGPNLYNYAWNGDLIPLDSCVSPELKADLLPSITAQGTYDGKLYGVGSFDSGVLLYAYRSALEEVGARIPTGIDDAWTAEEFTDILGRLQDAGYDSPLDAHMWYGRQGEWFSYAFSPIVQSAGGDLIDRTDFSSADGTLNSPEAVEAMSVFQEWFENGYVDTEAQDDSPFLNKTSPISWNGMWAYANGYHEAAGDDLVALPLPDFGTGSKTGMGSWQFGITRETEDPDAAWAFLEFLLQEENQLMTYETVGAPPSRISVLEKAEIYAEDGPLALVTESLRESPRIAVPRPQTPAYPAITQAFAQAVDDISNGGDVQAALDEAVRRIDQDITDNGGYPAFE
ncbi:sugar ABC transporter substrate-binding protein [Allostreptomyces psammosilenae]|uniref:Multiple sugar transport system substrate-binding protein n=1 Tax=Allostreptomyces psammosilenae TaxID=1892865 RepID=A0A853A3V3_9ACTN|nr:sugar ABC transporter substrate-binding protein [Allostreptomyces psammosilenae]NYI05168.1 multiple sugar transport system substrate-binding protein [Allostreptomyces psammosilenae]